MKLDVEIELNLKIKEAQETVKKAARAALKDVIIDIAQDAIQNAPPPPKIGTRYMSTGHNRRSIKFEVGPGGEVAKGDLEGAVYGTSGYSGYLEVGTALMHHRPYFKPALDRHARYLADRIKAKLP